jgi:hypothetical protein
MRDRVGTVIIEARPLMREALADGTPFMPVLAVLLGLTQSSLILHRTPFADLGLSLIVHNQQDDARLLLVVGFSVLVSEFG